MKRFCSFSFVDLEWVLKETRFCWKHEIIVCGNTGENLALPGGKK